MDSADKRSHAFIHILLILTESLVLSYANSPHEILLSRHHTCRQISKLTAQTDSYKIIFPENGPHCDECPSCNVRDTWTCQIKFFADYFTFNAFEVCLEVAAQKMRNCRTAHILYRWGSGLKLIQNCHSKSEGTCFGQEHEVRLTYRASYPCSFHGHSQIYLKPRSPATYVLFKEKRHCSLIQYNNETDQGIIVSEFNHRVQRHPDFCPVLLRVRDWESYTKFCILLEEGEFLQSYFAITISSVKKNMIWKLGYGEGRKGKSYCEDIRPEGYIVSAHVVSPTSLNSHRALLKYSFRRKVDDENDDDDDDDDEDDYDDDHTMSPFTFSLLIIIGCCLVVTTCLCWWCCCCKNKPRNVSGVASAPLQAERRTAPQVVSHESRALPSAPLINEQNHTPEAPPSYASLFPTKSGRIDD